MPKINSDGSAWSKTAAKYGSNVGQASSLGAARLIEIANSLRPITSTSNILDNGAGTGAITLTVASHFPQARITATDISQDMLDKISPKDGKYITKQVADALALDEHLDKATFTHVIATFVIQFVMDPISALQQMHHVLQPGGIIGIGIWSKRNDAYEVWERACNTLDPSYTLPAPFPDPNAWRTLDELRTALAQSGFEDVTVEGMEVPFIFEHAEDFSRFWLEGKNPGAMKVIEAFKGDISEARRVLEDIVRNEFQDGKGLRLGVVLGVGKKAITAKHAA